MSSTAATKTCWTSGTLSPVRPPAASSAASPSRASRRLNRENERVSAD